MSQTRNLPAPADQRSGESLAAPAVAGQGAGIHLPYVGRQSFERYFRLMDRLRPLLMVSFFLGMTFMAALHLLLSLVLA